MGQTFTDMRDFEKGDKLKREGMARVASHVSAEWKAEAYRIIRELAVQKSHFTTSDVWDAGLARPHDGRALGPMMVKAATMGWITKADQPYEKSRDPFQHRRPLQVWKSQIVVLRKSEMLRQLAQMDQQDQAERDAVLYVCLFMVAVFGVTALLMAVGWPGR